jgi:hypothetical protein
MPSDMAMHEPNTWIIGFKGDHDEATYGKEHNISSRWIVEFEVEFAGVVNLVTFLLQDRKVVAVEMDLMIVKLAQVTKGAMKYLQDAQWPDY